MEEVKKSQKRKSSGDNEEKATDLIKKPKSSQQDKESSEQPSVVLLFSGKRKSGKDFVTDILQQRIGQDVCTILRLSGPLKAQYAKDHNLKLDKLLDATEYKEKYRADMIKWGEEKRNQDPGYFCQLTTTDVPASFKVWIISDARRQTDVKYFKEHFTKETLTVRVEAKLKVRECRGYVFTKGVDDAESECDLDTGISWDFTLHNNGDKHTLDKELNSLIECVNERISKN
ncbi:phosphomevalonate kinase-like [Amphiura filiformis]|uniref:phosphomevalonate kinase-like n=1 Tax=Amphiura filiformis TaxID=82378 RepID=UPI003B2243C7